MPNYRQHFGFSDLLIFAPLIVWPDGTSKEDPSQTPCFSLFGESPLLALLLCVPPLMLWRALPLKTPERATWLTVVYIFHAACPALCRQFRIVKSILGANCATGKWTGGRGLYRRQASKVLTGVDHAAFLYTEASYGYALAEKGRFLASPQNFCMQNIRTIDQEKPRKRRQLPHSFSPGLELLMESSTLEEARMRYITGCFGHVRCTPPALHLRGTKHFLQTSRSTPFVWMFLEIASLARLLTHSLLLLALPLFSCM